MHKLSSQEIEDIKNGQALLIDVRTADEFMDGHAAYAINLPLDELDSIKEDTKKKLFVYCRSGNRSQMAEIILCRKGYDVTNIGGLHEAVDAIGEA